MKITLIAPQEASQELRDHLRAKEIARRSADLKAQGYKPGDPSGWDRVWANVPPHYVPTGYIFGIWLGMSKDELKEFSKW